MKLLFKLVKDKGLARMAGNWLKIESVTPDKEEIHTIAVSLDISPDDAFGKVFRVWRWFNDHTINGKTKWVSMAFINSLIGLNNFAEQMEKVGWLKVTTRGVTVPKFDRHNSESAKARGLAKKRQADKRSRDSHGDVTEKPLPEKKRKEKNQNRIKGGSLSQECGASISDSDSPISRVRAQVVFLDRMKPMMAANGTQAQSDMTCMENWFDVIWPVDASPDVAMQVFGEALDCIEATGKSRSKKPRMSVLTNKLKEKGLIPQPPEPGVQVMGVAENE